MNTLNSSLSFPISPAASVPSVSPSSVQAPPPPGTEASPFDYDPFVADYAASAGARASLTESEILPVNLDVQLVVPVVLRAAARIQPFRAAIAKQLPEFDLPRFDQLVPSRRPLRMRTRSSCLPTCLPKVFRASSRGRWSFVRSSCSM